MAEKENAFCVVCGKPYHVCMACRSGKVTPWKLHADTVEHYKVFQILTAHYQGIYTTDEAKEKLGSVDLSDLDTYRDHVKKQIRAILGNEEQKPVKAKRNAKKSVVVSRIEEYEH